MAFKLKIAFILFLTILGKIYCQTTTAAIPTTTTTAPTTTTTTTIAAATTTTTITTTFPSVPAVKNLGACVCDLTKDLCDINCCCDSSCSTADKNSFTVCIDEVIAAQIYNSRLCVPQSQIFVTNTPYIIESFQDLLCLTLDNYASLNYYQQPAYLTASQISALTSLVVPSKSTQSQSALFYKYSTTSYKANDPLWILSQQDAIGYLAMPNHFKGGNCEVNSPSTYLGTKTTTCTYANLQGKCTTTALYLNYNYFITTSALLKNANSIVDCVKKFNITSTATNLYQTCTDYIVKFNKTSCTLADGTVLNDCSANMNNLVLDAVNNKCTNLVKTVTYKIKYLNPNGIISADVDIEFTSATLTDSFQQTFKVIFESQNAATSLNSYKRSGNPGYLIGAPLVAGKTNSTQIILNTDSSTWFTIPKQGTDGKCSKSASSRSSINFGINAATDCIFDQSITNIDCTKLQNDIFEIILGNANNRPTRVATFGNSDIANPGAWIEIDKIDKTNIAKPDTTYKDVCDQLVTSATINVAYANAGDVTNPQAMILYVGYEWGTASKVTYQCFGQTCNNNLQIRITTKVIFIDISKPPEHIEAVIATPQLKLPENFFYPFILTTNNSNSINKNCILIHLLLFVILSFLIKKFI